MSLQRKAIRRFVLASSDAIQCRIGTPRIDSLRAQ
jgi:hypothetical protein